MNQSIQEEVILTATQAIEDQLDAEIARLDRMEDEDLQELERKRAAALKQQLKKKDELLISGHGQYSELSNDAEFFDACKKSKNVICHFYRNSTMRCAIVDKHFNILAPKHIEARFCKINVEKAPFLVERLHIRVLPTIAICKDAKTIDYIVGFDDLGGVDDFSTEMLEWRLARAQVINYSGDISVPPGIGTSSSSAFRKFKPKTIRGGCSDSDTD